MNFDLIDIGANLAHDSFDDDRAGVLQRAEHNGVRRLVVTGSCRQSSIDSAELAAHHPGRLFATAGVHPHHASDFDADTRVVLQELSRRETVVAIGECGLDFFRNFSPQQAQRDAFESQLNLAAECRLPVFLHQRDAHHEFTEILRPVVGKLPGAVAHCFTGDRDTLLTYLGMGLYIGITGWICDERRGRELQEIVREVPLDRLMIESDAPYLLPRSLRPRPKTRRNEPMYLAEVLRVVADCMGCDAETVAIATTRNAERFFELPAGVNRSAALHVN